MESKQMGTVFWLVLVIPLNFLIIRDSPAQTLRIAFYNVENLFDTLDAPGKRDESFLPNGTREWNRPKYRRKLKKIYKVLSNLGNPEAPALIGLAEIENRRVLEDLRCRTPLVRTPYHLIHYESPDKRGIDVALMFQYHIFKPYTTQAIPVGAEGWTSRDILYVAGTLPGGDSLHVYVNHWPSRWGGQRASEPRRMRAAQTLRTHLDSVLRENPEALIVIMGDFNDGPDNLSIQTLTKDKVKKRQASLTNLMTQDHHDGRGTHAHTSTLMEWSVLDQFIVSSSLATGHSGKWSVVPSSSKIFNKRWLLKKGRPFRSFQGTFATAGFSDHLPIVMDIIPVQSTAQKDNYLHLTNKKHKNNDIED